MIDIKKDIENSINIEIEALERIIANLDDNANKAVEMLSECSGRVIVTGMGKSGLVGRKIAATLTSTGASAVFLHPTEAFHGDLGMVSENDIAIAISTSGETEEVNELLPHLRRFSVKIIALTGNPKSTLAKFSDAILDVGVDNEVDILGLAPMASTTAALAMGDALAAVLLKMRGFTKEQFADFHPGGSLGKKLLITIGDLMHTGAEIPIVSQSASIRETIMEITRKKLGIALIAEDNNTLFSVFTDGDIRRFLEKDDGTSLNHQIRDYVLPNPKSITANKLAEAAVSIMEKYKITALPVVDEDTKIIGVIHLHDLLKAGIV